MNPVGQSVERADGRLKLAGQAEFTGDIRLPGMLYGAVLHSPVAHARISSIDTSAAEKLDGVVAILTGRGPVRPGSLLRPRAAGPPDRGHRQGPFHRRAGRGGRGGVPGHRRRRGRVHRRRVRRTARRGQSRGGAGPRRAPGPRGGRPAGQRARPGEAPRAGRQYLLQLLVPPRRHRACLCRRRGGRRGRVHLPRRLPVLDGDPHHDRALARRRADPVVLLPAPVPSPAGDRGAVRAAAGPGPGDRAVPRRRLRQQVLHQDGAADRGHRAQGRAPGADPQRGPRVDDHHPAAQHDLPDAHRGRRRRHRPRAHGGGLAGHRRVRGQRPPGHGHGRRRRPGSLPLAGGAGAGPLRLHQHRAGRLLPRVRRHPPAVDRGVAAG